MRFSTLGDRDATYAHASFDSPSQQFKPSGMFVTPSGVSIVATAAAGGASGAGTDNWLFGVYGQSLLYGSMAASYATQAPDGSIVMIVSVDTVVRYLADMKTRDTAFAGTGSIPRSTLDVTLRGLRSFDDGIYILGNASLFRRLADGSQDKTFGTDGRATPATGGIFAGEIQKDGVGRLLLNVRPSIAGTSRILRVWN